MVILEMKYLHNLRENVFEENKKSNIVSSDEYKSMNNSYSNSTINLPNENEADHNFHKNNLGLLLIVMIAFYILAYYLYYISKSNIKKAKINNPESGILHTKYQNMQNLSIATFIRGISIIYMVISFNRSGNDVVSFINYLMHIFPSLLFFSVYFSYVKFLIEKYYEIKTKRKDIFFNPTLQFFNILIYIFFFIVFLSSITTQDYESLMYLGTGMIFILSIVVSLLYLYYGVSLSYVYSDGRDTGEVKEKKYIHDRILFISLVFGTLFMTRAVLSFLISIKAFGRVYPSFLGMNSWDMLTFIFNEFLPSLIIGYTRHRDDKGRYSDKLNLESFDFNKNYQNFTGILRGNINEKYNLIENDLNDPLLEKIDKI